MDPHADSPRVCLLRATGAGALREFPGRSALAAARPCGRTLRRSTPSHAAPTISPTNRDPTIAERLRLLDGVAGPAPRDFDHPHRRCEPAQTMIFWALENTIRTLPASAVAVHGSAERLPAGRFDNALRHVARPPRLLPPLGKSGRPARAAGRRLRRQHASMRSPTRCARRCS